MTSLSGEWKLVNGGSTPVGTEKWRLDETATTLSYNSVIMKKTPFPHKEELHVTVAARSWETQKIEISSAPDNPAEQPSERFEGTRKNGSFEIATSHGDNKEHTSIAVSDSTEFDYLSPIFNTVTFHRLRLRRRETREIETLYIFPVSQTESFRTRIVEQRYQRLDDEPLSVPAGRFPQAKLYVYKNLVTGWTGNIWTDNLETVLRYEKFCELLSYHHAR